MPDGHLLAGGVKRAARRFEARRHRELRGLQQRGRARGRVVVRPAELLDRGVHGGERAERVVPAIQHRRDQRVLPPRGGGDVFARQHRLRRGARAGRIPPRNRILLQRLVLLDEFRRGQIRRLENPTREPPDERRIRAETRVGAGEGEARQVPIEVARTRLFGDQAGHVALRSGDQRVDVGGGGADAEEQFQRGLALRDGRRGIGQDGLGRLSRGDGIFQRLEEVERRVDRRTPPCGEAGKPLLRAPEVDEAFEDALLDLAPLGRTGVGEQRVVDCQRLRVRELPTEAVRLVLPRDSEIGGGEAGEFHRLVECRVGLGDFHALELAVRDAAQRLDALEVGGAGVCERLPVDGQSAVDAVGVVGGERALEVAVEVLLRFGEEILDGGLRSGGVGAAAQGADENKQRQEMQNGVFHRGVSPIPWREGSGCARSFRRGRRPDPFHRA